MLDRIVGLPAAAVFVAKQSLKLLKGPYCLSENALNFGGRNANKCFEQRVEAGPCADVDRR
jgi:hypothetical protein